MKGMTNMAEYGNKSHARKNRPVFFLLCEKMAIFANAKYTGTAFFTVIWQEVLKPVLRGFSSPKKATDR
ncbi:hypothetical protein B5E60_11490 [Alistipes sp. An116]|nr:hypothetical protein B5E60_11490 [Alistipes sp. An116]